MTTPFNPQPDPQSINHQQSTINSSGPPFPPLPPVNNSLDQQPKETNKAFAAFTVYVNLGPDRTISAVARKLVKSRSVIAHWSSKYHWPARIAQSESLSPQHSTTPPLHHSVPSQHSTTPPLHHSAWTQQPSETNRAFAAFTTYLALGPRRTIAQAAAATKRTRDQLAHWSVRWKWPARVAAYHAHLAAVELRATETLVAEKSHDWAKMHESVRRQAWAEAEDLIALAHDFKARWRDSDRLPAFDTIIRALDLAFKLKQFAAGLPSEIKEVNTNANLKATIDMDWEIAIRKAYGPKPDTQTAEILDIQADPAPIPAPSSEPPSEPPSPQHSNTPSLQHSVSSSR